MDQSSEENYEHGTTFYSPLALLHVKTTLADTEIFTPTTLPCGVVVPNRLIKVAMYEHMATLFGGPPNASHVALYSQWASGNWGMIFTGNVQVSGQHLSLGRDLVVPTHLSPSSVGPFQDLASAIHKNGTSLAIMQLCHAGRQSANILGGRWPFSPPLAPSAVPLHLGSPNRWWSTSSILGRLMFQTPREMTRSDIEVAVRGFVRGAKLAAQAGFDGVELHAAHGYLIAQFISVESNTRTDRYSATRDPLSFLRHIVSAIREPGVVPPDFILGIKLNAADYVQRHPSGPNDRSSGLQSEEEVLAQLREIARWKMVDFIEVSGGSYQNPDFMSKSTLSRAQSKREAIFARFSTRARAVLVEMTERDPTLVRPLIILTGGMSTPEILHSALRHKHADLLGIGRLSVLCPRLPNVLRSQTSSELVRLPDPEARKVPHTPLERLEQAVAGFLQSVWSSVPPALRPQLPKLIGAGTEMAWYIVAMRQLARAPPGDGYVGDGIVAILHMWLYVAPGAWSGGLLFLAYFGAIVIAVAFALKSMSYS